MGCTSSNQKPPPKKGKKGVKTSTPVAISFSSPTSNIDSALINYDDDSQILPIQDVIQLNRDDYGELIYVQSGACKYISYISIFLIFLLFLYTLFWFIFHILFIFTFVVGKVYRTTRLSDGKIFAMKFFGYAPKLPRLVEVEKEIGLMQALKGIPNVVQIEGIFMDTELGYIPDRESTHPYPVIVMEALQGGDLFDRIHDKGGKVTERYLATAFRGVVEALRDTHNRCFVHRDLKLENLMYSTKDADSAIKVNYYYFMIIIILLLFIFIYFYYY